MSFSGKRYKRTRYENMEDLITHTRHEHREINVFIKDCEKYVSPIFKIKRIVDRHCIAFAPKYNTQDAFGDAMRFLQNNAPIFCFTKIDKNIYNYALEADGRHISFNFTLGEEIELERRDGEKIKMTFTMPSDNIIHQVIRLRNGKVVNFIREFNNKDAKAIVTVDGLNDKQGTIYFEAVE